MMGKVPDYQIPKERHKCVMIPQLRLKQKGKERKFDPDLMKNLRFEAHWKEVMAMGSLKQFEIQTVSESTFPGQGDVWTYDLVLEDPLVEVLIGEMVGSDKKEMVKKKCKKRNAKKT